jgi:hypothetical protein
LRDATEFVAREALREERGAGELGFQGTVSTVPTGTILSNFVKSFGTIWAHFRHVSSPLDGHRKF